MLQHRLEKYKRENQKPSVTTATTEDVTCTPFSPAFMLYKGGPE